MNFVQPQVLQTLATERLLLNDITELLARDGAPPEDARETRAALRGLEESFLLVVVGEFNAGKSSLLNALLGADVLEEGVTPTTDRISILVHGEHDKSAPYANVLEGTPGLNIDEFVTRRELPYQFLEGVALVDTPGTNAVIRRHQALTEGFLPRADLVLFLTSADRPFTESERQFLELSRAWSRKVLVVVNKVDLLETDADREEVRVFVTRNAKEVLGVAPQVFMVSVKRFEQGGDAGFRQLENTLREVLGERDRSRLKLLSPLGVASRLLERARERTRISLEVLGDDTKTLNDLERQLKAHQEDLSSDLDTQTKGLDAILDGVKKRGVLFLDDQLRFRKTLDLLNPDKIRLEFEKTVIADSGVQLERRVNEIIDRFLARNHKFWDETMAFLSARVNTESQDSADSDASFRSSRDTREALLRGAKFDYDRKALLESLGTSVQNEVEGFNREEFSKRLAGEAQTAILQSGVAGVGGLGLGALLASVLGSFLLDFTGILVGLAAASLGLFILPRKRAQAKSDLETRINTLRDRLHEVLTREHKLESERATARLREASAPYTRFIRTETERLEKSQNDSRGLLEQVAALRTRIERLE
jgi:small GTP-binding protein